MSSSLSIILAQCSSQILVTRGIALAVANSRLVKPLVLNALQRPRTAPMISEVLRQVSFG